MVKVNERGTKRRPLKGAVLFTILCVMAVILIMMLVTIGLSSVASRRAYSEYYDAQINATGRSVISSVLKSLDPEHGSNKNLGKTIYQNVQSSGKYEVHLSNNGNLGQGLGRVDKIVFEKAAIDSESSFFVSGSDYMIMKVSATITMGNKTTTYSEYVSDMYHVPGKNGGNGGLLSTSGAETSGTGMAILGPFGGGFKDYIKKTGELELKNNGAYVGQEFFAQSIKINTYKTFVFDSNTPTTSYDIDAMNQANYQGISVLGDITIQNNSAPFVSRSTTADAVSTPYIFLTGKFDCSSATTVMIGSLGSQNAITDAKQADLIKQTSGNKVNLYCGSFVFPKNKMNIASDIYCYNNTATSVLGGDMNDTPLLTWVEDQVSSGTLKNANTISGDIYTKGNLKLVATKVAVKGNVYVGGQLDLTELQKTSQQIPDIAGGKIYCTSVNPTDYTTFPAGTSDQYKNLVGKIEVVASATFPAEMELDKILGIKYTGSPANGAAQLAAVESGAYTIDNSIDFSKKIIQNPLEMNNKFYKTESGSTVLRNSYSQSGVVAGSPTYTNDNIPANITSQCTIQGDIWGKVIKITPRPKSENKELWITLDNVSLLTLGSTNSEIVVASKVDDGHGNMVDAGDVCFYVKDGTSLNLKTGARIVTSYYADNYLASTSQHSKLSSPISINNGSMSQEYIPNIYIYGSNKEDEITAESQREVLNFENCICCCSSSSSYNW